MILSHDNRILDIADRIVGHVEDGRLTNNTTTVILPPPNLLLKPVIVVFQPLNFQGLIAAN